MPAPKEVLELVERFQRNRQTYEDPHFNETETRVQFLNPLFKALGWDVDNTAGYAEAYKDVIHEDAVRVGAATKAPDYCFTIGGARKFFLEAKKPAVNIKNDTNPAYQLRRYGWSAKLPVSVLSNFAELTVYDCRARPDKDDKASKGRIQYWECEQYADKWDEIASIFSKDAILKGSFDKFAISSRNKRGTAEVDDEFLNEIEEWRDFLAKNIALRNPKIAQRDLNFAVQQTIDRIIFLRICEDRGIEPYGRLQALQNGENIYERLKTLFHQADDRYNSGLFHFREESDRKTPPDVLTPLLKIDDKPLKDIFKRLYYPDSPYEFSVLSADILGQVYEQFLGKVIRLTTAGHAKVEDKPEVKKAGGVYYTPTYIVNYIVKKTVGKLLEGKTTNTLKRLAVLDPACGSGSFLLGAYQYLLDWYLKQYVEGDTEKNSKGRRPKIFKTEKTSWRLTTRERKRILLEHVYGVDIDPQAVEVTKLSLLLKVLEEESAENLNRNWEFFHERALPDLESNIKCGNSLIGPDFWEEKFDFDDDERYRVNDFNWRSEFPDIFKAKGNRGFDAVIGNPPYGAYLFEQDKEYLGRKFTCQNYQLDSYLLFLEQALKTLLIRGGLYGMIIPNPWLTNLMQKAMRKFVVENARIDEIVHFAFPVFPRVTVDTEVLVLENGGTHNSRATVKLFDSIGAFSSSPPQPTKTIYHSQEKWRELDGDVINIFLGLKDEALASKIVRQSVSLESVCDINVGIKPYQVGKGTPKQTRKIVETRPFDSSKRIDASFRAYLRGSDIGRYKVVPVEPRFLKYGPWLAEPRPAANFDAPEKLVMRQTGDSLVAAIDTKKFLCLNNMHVLVTKNKEVSATYLLGVINSRLLNWYYQTLNPEVGEALAEVKRTNVARLPIRAVDSSIPKDKASANRIISLVAQMILLQHDLTIAKSPHGANLRQREIEAIDRQIDKVVYSLYGLSEDEIKIVEGTA